MAIEAFMQYYRENGLWKERTYDFVPRESGLEEIQSIILDEESGEPERLRERLRDGPGRDRATRGWSIRPTMTKNQNAGEVGRE